MITVDQPSCNYLRCSCPSCSGGGRGETCIPHIVAAYCSVFAMCLQCVCRFLILLQRVAVCCSVLQCIAVCLQCLAVWERHVGRPVSTILLHRVAVYFQFVCSVFLIFKFSDMHVTCGRGDIVGVYAVCCSVLQCLAVCCSVFQIF